MPFAGTTVSSRSTCTRRISTVVLSNKVNQIHWIPKANCRRTTEHHLISPSPSHAFVKSRFDDTYLKRCHPPRRTLSTKRSRSSLTGSLSLKKSGETMVTGLYLHVDVSFKRMDTTRYLGARMGLTFRRSPGRRLQWRRLREHSKPDAQTVTAKELLSLHTPTQQKQT